MSRFLYQHGLDSIGEKFDLNSAQVKKLAGYVREVGGFDDAKVVKVLWAAQSPSVKELLKMLELIPEPPEEADQLDPFETKTHNRNTVMHSPQSEPAGLNYGLFSAPAGESSPTSPLE